MRSWEQTAARVFVALRLDSTRSKVLAFAVLATLIPSLSTAWVSYLHNKRSLTEKITQGLEGVSAQTARELDLWLKERLYDLRVFASSYEVTENLEGVTRAGQAFRGGRGLERLTDYLNSVQGLIGDYQELLVFDSRGRLVATSGRRSRAADLPDDWLGDLRAGEPVVSDAQWDDVAGRVILTVAAPVEGPNRRFLGAFTARLNLTSVDDMLLRFAPRPAGRVSLVTRDGLLITSSDRGAAAPLRTRLEPSATRELFDRSGVAVEYTSFRGTEVVGALDPVIRLGWAVVAEMESADAFRQVRDLRNLTLGIVAALLLGVGSLGYFLAALIVRPLNRLAQGAAKVAGGDLAVDLPVVSSGEARHLTEVFNDMVARLRRAREELERLSVTDGLTGLANRRRLMEALAEEARRFERHKRGFAVLMADIDHFKEYNDSFGHLAGDQVLARVGDVLRDMTRDVDCAARYGGEEFVVMMPETDLHGAVEVAERIRGRLAGEVVAGGRVTVSIGVAAFPRHGDSPDAVLAAADAVLYEAKGAGRNRVVIAAGTRPKESKAGAD